MRRGMLITAAASVMLLAAASAVAQEAEWMTAPRDWGATLRADATAFHDAIQDSHPGPVDPLNPAFGARLEAGLATALERAEEADTAGGWWWAMRALQAGFDDGHVQLRLTQANNGFPASWAGLITVYRGDDQWVADVDEADPSLPPLGARLVDCDGVDAATLGEQRVGQFRGRWFLEAQRVAYGTETLLNLSNPWIANPSECRFEANGQVRSHAMSWRPISSEELGRRRGPLGQWVQPDFAFRTLDDGALWVSMPTFDGTPGGEPSRQLTAIIEQATARQAELRAAPYVVLDLRGNGGGSSQWSALLAEAIWGEAWLSQHQPRSATAVDWRASAANLAAMQEFQAQLVAENVTDPEILHWAQSIVDGITAARAEGQPYWSNTDDEAAAETGPVEPATNPVGGVIYVLTDARCASACLDAVDVWKAAGAVQIGRETSADTLYMDVRDQDLPSGLAAMAIPMKVYRGRARGNNEPQSPLHVFDGDMADESAILAWIHTLQGM